MVDGIQFKAHLTSCKADTNNNKLNNASDDDIHTRANKKV